MAVILPLVLALFPIVMIWAAVSDLLTMKIPNRLSIALVAGFAVAALLAGFWPSMLWPHLLAFAIVLACGFGLFSLRLMGGGDAKLASATALWLGLDALLPYLFATALAGGVLTLAIILLRRIPIPASALEWQWLARLRDPRSGVPYGIALAIGALITAPKASFFMPFLKI